MTTRPLTFPLVPRRRLVGMAFGGIHGARRGLGTDVAGSRPYLPGDDRDAIDWGASARLSSARGTEEFIVREHFTDEAPRVVIVTDHRPEMALCPPEFPWLRKNEAMRVAAELVTDSVAEARGFVGYLDLDEGDGEPYWQPPTTQAGLRTLDDRHLRAPFRAPPDTIERSLEFLGSTRRAVPPGSFVFVVSDFLVRPRADAWERALDRHWDVVPIVVQDPLWEQSFPVLDGIVLPLAEPNGRVRLVRLRAEEAAARRDEHERRLDELLRELHSFGMHPILVSSTDPEDVYEGFVNWASERAFARGRRL